MGKKKVEEKKSSVLGRVGTQLKIGIVGLPNVGKSTLFNILTNSNAKSSNFSFCTIDPNEAQVAVPDKRFNWLVKHWQPAKAAPAILKVTDIAGLVAGASEGKGLGNAFLSHIKGCDAIFHLVRIFDDVNITHEEGYVDPLRDLEIITSELIKKDLLWLTARHSQLVKKKDKGLKPEIQLLDKLLTMLQEGKEPRLVENWESKEIDFLNEYQLLTAKKVVYLINMSERDYLRQKNKWLGKIMKWISAKGKHTVIPFSAVLEKKIFDVGGSSAKKKYCKDLKIKSQIPNMITSGFKALSLIYFFTCGKDEVKCWPLNKYSRAPQAGGKIHSDFETGFINCEVMKYVDFKEYKSEGLVKEKGKVIVGGKTYVVEDGDIIHFKFGKRKKKKK